MRKPGVYMKPRFTDPRDKRLVRMIRTAKRSRTNSVNIIGIPFDGAVLGRKGAKEGPAAIRHVMTGFSNYNLELGVGLEGARISDLGDISLGTEDVVRAHRMIESEVFQSLEASSLLVILGGDNSISLPALTALSRRFGKIGLVVVDSHFDLRGKIGGKPTSGSSYGLAIETLQGLDPHRVVEIGIHGFLNSKSYAEEAQKQGVRVYTAKEVREAGPEAVAREAYATAAEGADAVYLSVDLDAVDLAWVSGVSAPSAGGVSASELLGIVHAITKMSEVKCMDLVELAPSLDSTGRSAVVAATALTYAVAGFVSRRQKASR